MKWYALFVESGKEETVQKFLRLQFDEQALYSIIPKKKSQNEKPESNTRHSKRCFRDMCCLKRR